MNEVRTWLQRPAVYHSIKLTILIVLILILLIPLALIRGVVDERGLRHEQATAEVIAQAGGRQQIIGLFLMIPIEYTTVLEDGGQVVRRREEMIFADDLAITAALDAEELERGIYTVPVFESVLAFDAHFKIPDLEGRPIWDESRVAVAANSFGSLAGIPELRGDAGAVVPFQGSTVRIANYVVMEAPVATSPGASFSASVDLTMRGGGAFQLLPTARESTVAIESNWSAPSFTGAMLPSSRELDTEGFRARWSATALGLGLPVLTTVDRLSPATLQESLFGAELYLPVDRYQRVERAVKYGALFILLPFAALFLLEMLTKERVHPVQYLLVASAKLVFYLLLLSLSEQIAFSLAYWAAAVATIALLGFYLYAAVSSARRALVLSGLIAAEYLFLFVALSSQDYALLIGSVGLFAMIAAVMIGTRRINWYAPSGEAPAESGAVN